MVEIMGCILHLSLPMSTENNDRLSLIFRLTQIECSFVQQKHIVQLWNTYAMQRMRMRWGGLIDNFIFEMIPRKNIQFQSIVRSC